MEEVRWRAVTVEDMSMADERMEGEWSYWTIERKQVL